MASIPMNACDFPPLALSAALCPVAAWIPTAWPPADPFGFPPRWPCLPHFSWRPLGSLWLGLLWIPTAFRPADPACRTFPVAARIPMAWLHTDPYGSSPHWPCPPHFVRWLFGSLRLDLLWIPLDSLATGPACRTFSGGRWDPHGLASYGALTVGALT